MIERLVSQAGVRLPDTLGKELILSWDDVREMSDNGVTFGAHTVTHPTLTKLPLKQAEYEIAKSKKDIEEKLNRIVTAFSYPYGCLGDFDSEIKQIVQKSGFTCAVTVIPRLITPETDLYELPRINPGGDINTLKISLSGLYPDLRSALSGMGTYSRQVNNGAGFVEEKGFPKFLRQYTGSRQVSACLLYTSPSPRDLSTSRMPSSA